jgi:hypothetical protein
LGQFGPHQIDSYLPADASMEWLESGDAIVEEVLSMDLLSASEVHGYIYQVGGARGGECPGGSSTYPLNSTLEIQMGVILDLVDIFRVKDNQWSHRDELKDIGPLFHFGQFEAGV